MNTAILNKYQNKKLQKWLLAHRKVGGCNIYTKMLLSLTGFARQQLISLNTKKKK